MSDLAQIVARHIANAERTSDARADLFDRYMGEPLGDEVAGRSAAMTSEVFDTVEAITAEMMDLLASEPEIVSFMPQGADDETQAKAETEACNHVFWERNNGFEVLQTWAKAGLIEQVGYCRSGWVESEKTTIDEYTGLTLDDALALKAKYDAMPGVESVDLIEYEGFEKDELLGYIPTFDEDGMPEPISFKLRCVKTSSEYEIEPVAQSSILITPRWHKVSVQDVPFLAIEHTEYTRSDLVAMGFHPDDVAKLSFEAMDENDTNRHDTHDNEDVDGGSVDDVTEAMRVYECFILADTNGDGIAERQRVWMATDASTVLRWADGSEAIEEVDAIDVSAWTPITVPHRHVGRAASEIVDDVQAINTVLLRHTLDSIYANLYARPVVNDSMATKDTYADLALPDHGAAIRVRGPGAIEWQAAPDVSGVTLPMMEKMNAIKEERTGVTRLNQGMDVDTLNKTASGQQMLLSQGQKRLKLMVRNLAEGLADMFIRMHRDLRRGNIRKLSYKRGGTWQEQDPLKWQPRHRMAVSVGSGNGDRMEKQQTVMMVGQVQRELAASGSDMVDDVKIFETIDRAVKMGGYPSASLFLNDPRSDEYKQAQASKPPPEPDAATILATAEAEKARAMAQKAQAEAQRDLARIQLDAITQKQAHEARMQEMHLKEVKAAADMQTKAEAQDLAEKAQADANSLGRDKLAVDIINADRTS